MKIMDWRSRFHPLSFPLFFRRMQLLRRAPLALLLGGWALSGMLLVLVHRQQQRDDAAGFVQLTANAQAAIRQRLVTYVDALRSGVSFLVASPVVGREEWTTFAETLDLPGRYPGINGFGVIYLVPSEEAGGFLQRVRADGAPDSSTFSSRLLVISPANSSRDSCRVWREPLPVSSTSCKSLQSSRPLRRRFVL